MNNKRKKSGDCKKKKKKKRGFGHKRGLGERPTLLTQLYNIVQGFYLVHRFSDKKLSDIYVDIKNIAEYFREACHLKDLIRG
jgi:hypothetical protein